MTTVMMVAVVMMMMVVVITEAEGAGEGKRREIRGGVPASSLRHSRLALLTRASLSALPFFRFVSDSCPIASFTGGHARPTHTPALGGGRGRRGGGVW